MSLVTRMLTALALVAVIGNSASAQQSAVWETDLNRAMQTAVKTNKLVLVHFGATWCQPCKKLEQNVFNQPGFGADLQNSFVLVKLDFDLNNNLAKQWGVKAIPADVILTPYGKFVERIQSPATADRYNAAVYQAALKGRSVSGPLGGLFAGNTPTPTPPSTTATSNPPAAAAPTAQQPVATMVAAQQPISRNPPPPQPAAPASYAPAAQSAVPPATVASANTQSPVAAASAAGPMTLPPGVPPLGLEGHCPVALVERRNWVPGDTRWGAIHQGRTYLFSGPTEQQRFLADPDHYSPALAGNDPVLALEQHQQVPGAINCGVFYSKRIYLFQSAETLAKFRENPDRYAAAGATVR